MGGAKTVREEIELLNNHKMDAVVISFCETCVTNKKTSMSNLILNRVEKGITIHSAPNQPLNLLLACGTVEIIEKVSATMYVPVTEADLEKISAAPGVATFLEGGLATVEGTEDWTELLEIGADTPVEGELCI
jgi:hypothetical protein